MRTEFENDGFGWCLWTYKKMDNDHCIVQIQQPKNFDLIQNYANGTYKEWIDKVKAHPDNAKTREALFTYLDNCLLKNCKPSTMYHKVLKINQQ